jgi:hypothetical protein
MTRHGRYFTIIDSAGGLAPASKTGMIEQWIGERIKLRRNVLGR